jgi:UDP-N-acetylglucosamine--N-acetylmuramyl-(pentapeptide) pyrophosphoryl-undecaprenol N-acetylglucosamine transferase
VGNPIASSVLALKPKEKISKTPTILITGGSTGAQRINRVVDEILERLLPSYQIIHLTGDLDFENFQKRKRDLPKNLGKKYEVYSFIEDMAWAYARADMVVGRSGANTVAEIMAARRPAILVPIPWTRYNEQNKNAQLAHKAGIAEIIDQEALTGKLLFQKIEKVKSNWQKMVKNMNQELTKLDAQAAASLVELVGGLVK